MRENWKRDRSFEGSTVETGLDRAIPQGLQRVCENSGIVPKGRLNVKAVQISELFGSVGLILLDELRRQTSICEPGWLATFVEVIGVAVVGAKNEALFPGRVPHVRPSVHGRKKVGRSPFQCSSTRIKDCGQEQECWTME